MNRIEKIRSLNIKEKIKYGIPNFIKEKGFEPTKVYLGKAELSNLMLEIGSFEYGVSQFMGLDIFEVNLEDHFNIC